MRKHKARDNVISIILGIAIGLIAAFIQIMTWPVEVYAAEPVLVDVTGYCKGTIGCRGDTMRSGYCATRPEDYGKTVLVYRAEKTENGYEMGDLLYYLESRDTGYGKDTRQGKSKIFKGRTAGTIETGLQIDIFRPTYEECVTVMEETGGKAFIQILEVEG